MKTASLHVLCLSLALAALAAAACSGRKSAEEPVDVLAPGQQQRPPPLDAPAAAAPAPVAALDAATLFARTAHLDRVSRADYCATCHPEATAESRQNTHGRAFSDEEVRLATARFSIDGCIACHTPRPVFETGIGMNPKKRLAHLEEGNDCFSCHARKGYDFSTFVGSAEECKSAFDERVGTVEACASCHKNHGTPYQWENAAHGKQAGNECIDCHMPKVVRPVALGGEPRETRRHTFFASRSESQLRRAYAYRARIEGNEVVVAIENKGAGHNFPTELKQRAVESLVIVRDQDGNEVSTSRQVHRDPYKRPYGLKLPVNTQIPSGETREHRVPIHVAAGTVETSLYYKLYYPIEDQHPNLSRRLETRTLPFSGITPSTKPVESAPELNAHLPDALPVEAASPGNLVDFARPTIDKVEVEIPDGTQPGDVARLIALFQFPVGEANRKAQDKLVELGPKAVPELVAALGSWDGKTWTQAKNVLGRMGDVGRSALVDGIAHQELYVQLHAIEALPKFGDLGADRAAAIEKLKRGLASPEPLVRAACAQALGNLRVAEAAPLLRPLLDELDWDVCACAARALGTIGDKASLEKLRSSFERVRPSVETARDLAWALGALGDDHGMNFLLDGLDHRDDLVRESMFENFLDLTGQSRGYAPSLAQEERLYALANLRNWWASEGGVKALRTPRSMTIPGKLRAEVEKLVKDLGGDDMHASTPEKDEEMIARLTQIGTAATPMLIDGLKWPSGFSAKRAGILRALAASPDTDALAALIDATRDPVTAVALWAVEGLSSLRDPAGVEATLQFEQRFEGLVSAQRVPPELGSADNVRALVARARARMGDAAGGESLIGLLYSRDLAARATAEAALAEAYAVESTDEPAVAVSARRALADLPEVRAQEIEALRVAFDAAIESAEAAGEAASTTEARLAALALYDHAEAAVMRYAQLDPRAWTQDFDRARVGSDAVAESLAKDQAWIEGRPWRDALAMHELVNWDFGASKPADGDGTVAIDTRGSGVRIDTSRPQAKSLMFVIGANEGWRDYEFEIGFTLDAGMFGTIDHASADGHHEMTSCVQTSVGEEFPAGLAGARVEAGSSIVLRQRVIGGTIVRTCSGGAPELAITTPTPADARRGGLGIWVAPSTKLRISSLRVRPLRVDAAWTAK